METGRPASPSVHRGTERAPQPAAPRHQREEDWKRHTRAGNKAHACGRFVLARHSYARALDLAEEILAGADGQSASGAVPIFVIACHNAGDNLLALGRRADALGFYEQAFEQVLALAARTDVPDVLREAARRNLTQVTTGLLRLMKETGMPTDRIKSVLTRAQTLNTSTLAMG